MVFSSARIQELGCSILTYPGVVVSNTVVNLSFANRMTIQELGLKPLVLDELSEVLDIKSEEIEVRESLNEILKVSCSCGL